MRGGLRLGEISMKIGPMIAAIAIIAIIIVGGIIFFSSHDIIKISNYDNETHSMIELNSAFQIENGFLDGNYTLENYSEGPLYNSPKGFLGYAAIRKSHKECSGLLGNLTGCQVALYVLNTQTNSSISGKGLVSTSLYQTDSKAHEMFILQLEQLNSSNATAKKLSLNNPNILRGGLGKNYSEYALYTEPTFINGTQKYLEIILFRRNNVLLEGETISTRQDYRPSFWQVSGKESDIEQFNKKYFSSQ